jgi:hypothetical protein
MHTYLETSYICNTFELVTKLTSCLHDPALPGWDVRWDDSDVLK